MQKIVTILFILVSGHLFAQNQKTTVQEYIDMYKDLAMSEMKRTGVPASITLAQGILESESGNGELLRKSNNHFGIKCKNTWTGNTVYYDDDARGECFRKYDTPEESFRDHSNFLKSSDRYSSLFSLDPSDYQGWSYGLKKAGYATNPRYPEILISNIEKYTLQQYTQLALQATDKNGGITSSLKVLSDSSFEIINNEAVMLLKKTNRNGLKAVFVKKGISLIAIATHFNISFSKLIENNDLLSDGMLEKDQWIYLEKKKKEVKQEFHIVEEGEDIRGIAQLYGIQLSSIRHINNSMLDSINIGDKIYLRKNIEQGKSQFAMSSVKIHVVQPKEGLYGISKKYNVTIDDLKKWNHLDSDNLKVGQQLIISK